MNYIKQHWFGMGISCFMAYFLLVFIMVAVSPQNDEKNRGFIPCSHEQTEKIINCQKNKVFCVLSASVRGNVCYMKVLNKGFFDFVIGKQPRPWSNYLFTPEIVQNPEKDAQYEAELQAILAENPTLVEDMEKIKEKNQELLEKINKYQEDKINYDEK